MANIIQIKRSLNTANPTGLANGEFAYTANGDVLFIGSNGSVVAIAGARNPGTLTANQALVANSTSGIDKIIVANAVITKIYANGSFGSANQVLTTNGTASFWANVVSLAGSDTQVQFNDAGTLNATAGFTFTKSTNTLTVGTATINSTNFSQTANNSLYLGGTAAAGYQTTAGLAANVLTLAANSATYLNGKTESNLNVNNALTSNNATYLGGVAAASYVTNTYLTTNYTTNTTVYSTFAQNTTVYSTFAQNTAVYSTFAQNTSVYSTFAQNTAVYANFAQLAANNTLTGNNTLGGTTTTISSNLNVTGLVANNLYPAANTTYNLGNNTLRFNEGHFLNVHSVSGYFDGQVTISGNLVVSGNVTTTGVDNVIISDPLIYLAGNNYSSDAVDIGFVGNYKPDANERHTGLFRRASDDSYYLFKGLTQELSGVVTVNVADPTFVLADLRAYLLSGGLVSNAAAVTITANASVNVNITANTLTLSTPLAATSGGTGYNTYTSGDILVANSGNSLSKLSLGTSGYILQSNGSALVYASLDGGSF